MRAFAGLMMVTSLAACGGSTPPPKVEEPVATEPTVKRPRSGSGPQVAQELGSIDQAKVEQTFAGLQRGALETCHTHGRDRIEFLTGDVKVFLRIDGGGKVRYGYFEDSTLGDRETEKCILGALSAASWPKPEGGEAEVRSGFGWGGGGEREPTAWSADKVTSALADAKLVKGEVEKCKAGTSAGFALTAYVEQAESTPDDKAPAPASAGKSGKPKPGAKPAPHVEKGPVGKFKAIGVATKSKEGAEKIDCLVEALRPLELPSPGSYAAKVTFSL